MENPNKEPRTSGVAVLDRLSNLPNAVLFDILSFLDDTRCAIRTSVLSKRWRELWKFLPDLSFDSSYFADSQSFNSFVFFVLGRRDKACKVRRFRYSIPQACYIHNADPENVVSLRDIAIKYALRRGVNHIILTTCSLVTNLLPSPIDEFECQTLRTLELVDFDMSQSTCSFNTITTLHLEECVVENCFDVLESFPNLTNLTLINLCFYHEDEVTGEGNEMKISGSKLVTLRMEADFRQDDVYTSLVELDAPNLKYFKYQVWNLIDDFSVIHLPSLQHAEIYFSDDGTDVNELENYISDLYFKLLNGICNVEFLKLNFEPLETLNDAGLLEDKTCSFTELKSLKLLVDSWDTKVKPQVVHDYVFLGQQTPPSPESYLIPEQIKTYLLSGTPHAETVKIELMP